jgi:hypothetical protein
MDISMKNEIDSCIQGYFEDAIKGSYEGEAYCSKIVRKDHYNYAMPCIIVQWWYCEEYNKVYIYYDLDEVFFILNKDDLEKRINTRILSSITNDLHIFAEIIDNIIYGNQFVEPMDSPVVLSNEKISLSVLTYWKSIEGDYNFIHDAHIVIPKMLDRMGNVTKEKEAKVQEYASKLAIIARDYEAYEPTERNARIPIVFNDINNLFKECFGYRLPDPRTYPMTHPHCGPHVMYLDIYSNDTIREITPE